MANVANEPSLVDGQAFLFSEGLPRGTINYEFAQPGGGGGSTRPAAGQAWPRGNTRGNS